MYNHWKDECKDLDYCNRQSDAPEKKLPEYIFNAGSTEEYYKRWKHLAGNGDNFKNFVSDWQKNEHYADDSCAAYGSRLGRTQSFITAVYCEMMRAYTVRCAPGDGTNPPWMWEVFFRNNWIHIACSISFWLTIAITLIPWISDFVFSLYAPPFLSYLIAIAFPIANAALDEFVPKPLYKVLVVYPAMKEREKAEQAARD